MSRVIAAVLWVVGMWLLTRWSNGDAAIGVGIAATLLLGAVVGRWWVLLVPIVPGSLFALFTALNNETDADGVTGTTWALYILIATFLVAALVMLGVFIHQVIASRRWTDDVRDRLSSP